MGFLWGWRGTYKSTLKAMERVGGCPFQTTGLADRSKRAKPGMSALARVSLRRWPGSSRQKSKLQTNFPGQKYRSFTQARRGAKPDWVDRTPIMEHFAISSV